MCCRTSMAASMARLGSLSQRVASADARSCVVALRNFRSCVGLLAARAVPGRLLMIATWTCRLAIGGRQFQNF